MNVDIGRILLRQSTQGAENCPLCRYGPKHLVSLDCLNKFWRPVLPRKFEAPFISRHCFFYYGGNLMNIYSHQEIGYAVCALHYALARTSLSLRTEFFWQHIIEFLREDVSFRKITILRAFEVLLHVIESLSWHSQNGELFPMLRVVWFLLDGFLLREPELRDLIEKVTVKEYIGEVC